MSLNVANIKTQVIVFVYVSVALHIISSLLDADLYRCC